MKQHIWTTLGAFLGCVMVVHVLDPQVCKRDDECSMDRAGSVCVLQHNPCDIGTCRCLDGYFLHEGQCIKEAKLEEECQIDAQCLATSHALCIENFCQCRVSHEPYHGHCKRKSQYKIGDECTANHECVYYDEDLKLLTGALCIDAICQCPDNMITEDNQCKRRLLNDGCRGQSQCGFRGAVCEEGSCQCQAGYREINSRLCRLESDIGDMKAGEMCGPEKRCKEDLVCKKCHHKAVNKTCVYLSSGTKRYSINNYILAIVLVAVVTASTKFC